jgi:hypothetical protein
LKCTSLTRPLASVPVIEISVEINLTNKTTSLRRPLSLCPKDGIVTEVPLKTKYFCYGGPQKFFQKSSKTRVTTMYLNFYLNQVRPNVKKLVKKKIENHIILNNPNEETA